MASFTPAYFLELYLCESTLMTLIVLEWLYIEVYRLIICMWSKAEARGPKVNLFLSHTVCLYINWCIEIAMLLCNSSEYFSHCIKLPASKEWWKISLQSFQHEYSLHYSIFSGEREFTEFFMHMFHLIYHETLSVWGKICTYRYLWVYMRERKNLFS